MVHEVASDAEFNELIGQDKLVIVDFYATWCGPCRFVSPKVEEMSKKYTDAVFLKVDVDKLSNVAANCEISAMPTFQLFKSGQKLDEIVGADANRVEAAIKKHL